AQLFVLCLVLIDIAAEVARDAQVGKGRPAPQQRDDQTKDTHATPAALPASCDAPPNKALTAAQVDLSTQVNLANEAAKRENVRRHRGNPPPAKGPWNRPTRRPSASRLSRARSRRRADRTRPARPPFSARAAWPHSRRRA